MRRVDLLEIGRRHLQDARRCGRAAPPSVLPVLKWKAKARRSGSGTGSRVTADQKTSSAGTRKAISGSFTLSRRTTTPTVSVAAIPIRASSEASSGKSARSSAAAMDGGTATDTTGAWKARPSARRTS